jgi:hypothetical protein
MSVRRATQAGLAGFLLAFSGTGCAIAPVMPADGALVSIIEAPLDIDFDQTSPGAKKGEASVTTVLGIATGDASAAAAAKAGGITTIRHADYRYLNILFLYSRFTLVVYGD